jgi:hypothetical protein
VLGRTTRPEDVLELVQARFTDMWAPVAI